MADQDDTEVPISDPVTGKLIVADNQQRRNLSIMIVANDYSTVKAELEKICNEVLDGFDGSKTANYSNDIEGGSSSLSYNLTN